MQRLKRALFVPLLLVASVVQAQHITTPKEFFGHNIGDDYFLANYDQFMAYWRKIDAESDRMRVFEIGKTAEGRPQLAAIVTAPANYAKLDRYKDIAKRLALAEGLDSTQARALAKEGKAVVWIDGGLHATEVLGAHQLIETSFQFVSKTDEETMRILNDVIIVFVHANPDGMQLVSNWYMSEQDTLKRNMQIPRLYQKYIGHDNNRDFYMSAQPETQNMNHQLYWEWFPQIMYNHHQTGPAGSVMFAPPFRDPHNPNFDRLIVSGLDLVGAAMHNRFIAENKGGVVMRRGANYSTWWNGGLRTTVYFHNMIGLLTETIGNPTPIRIPLIPSRQEPTADMILPIEPQEWHFRQSIDYSITANYAVLDMAQRYRETFLFNIWRMGMNSIERGKRDTWTTTGPEVDKLRAAADSARKASQSGNQAAQGGGGAGGFGAPPAPQVLFDRILRDPADRDPRAYVVPASQSDFPTATKFINTLRHVGVTVERATRDFTIAGKTYPAGSYVVPMSQAFRPHVLDMFEPQEHPNDFNYPGAPPNRPYDNAGYTLAYQMGVQFDRILDAYTCPCEKIAGMAAAPTATVANAAGANGFILTPKQNDAFIAVSRLLKGNAPVSRLTAPFTVAGRTYPTGSFYVPASGNASQVVQTAARQLGIRVEGVTSRPGAMAAVRMPRVALADQYGGNIPTGWTRWIMEQFEMPYTMIYPAEINAGNLRAKYDVLVLPDGAIPNPGGFGGGGGFGGPQRQPPDSLRYMVGRIGEQAVAPIKAFLDAGGEVLAIGSSTRLGYMLNLPVKNALVEKTASGEEKELPGEKYYIPGSLLEVAVDTAASIAWGSARNADVMFDDSPAFRLDTDAAAKGLRTIAWYDSPTPLRSGWAWGQSYLNGAAAIIEARVGQGSLYMFGPEILFRSQPHGTFKFFFNALLDPSRSPSPPTP